MNPDPNRRTLHLVPSRPSSRIDASRFRSDETVVQGSLFPSTKPGVVLFLHFEAVQGNEFTEVLPTAQPGFVFDLRLAPRFDIGNLNRRSAFGLFAEVNATYIDTTGPVMMGQPRETAVELIREALSRTDSHRPLLFLFGSNETSIVSEDEMLHILAAAGKPATDLVTVPV